MGITRPRSEQIRLESSKTGSHILDTYLENAERGTRTLAQLTADLWDASGNLTSGYLELQITAAGKLQFRTGGAGSWTDILDLFVHQGSWAGSTAYDRTDTVLYSGQVYICVTAHTSSGSFATDAANWVQAIALAGNPIYYRGTFDASAAYPSTPSAGDLYIASVAGTLSGDTYDIGDMALYNGTAWEKIESNANDKVSKSGDTMTGALNVPASASGTQVPQAQEVYLKASDEVVLRTEDFNVVYIAAPEVAEYDLTRSSPKAGRVKTVRAICTAGTATISVITTTGTVKSGMSVSTTVAEDATINTTYAKGDRIYVDVTAASSCEGLEVLFGA